MKIHASVRYPVALVLVISLLAFGPCAAQAQDAALWSGYAVLAQSGNPVLNAAAVQEADGSLRLLIGAVENGAMTMLAQSAHALPASWAGRALVLAAGGDGVTVQSSWVMASAAPDGGGAAYYTQFILWEDGWQLSQMRGENADGVFYILHNTGGGWRVEADSGQTAQLPEEAIAAPLADADFDAAIATAATAIADTARFEAQALADCWQAAYAATPWQDADILTRVFHYEKNDLVTMLAAARTADAAVVCVFHKTADGAWEAQMNAAMFPADTTAEDVSLRYGDLDNAQPEVPQFTVRSLSADGGPQQATFARSGQGVWQLLTYRFQESENDFWQASFTGPVAKLYAGSYIGEEGYLYGTVGLPLTVFAGFDFQQAKNEMYRIEDNFLSGEPPYIPTGASAYALPLPCGAALRKGKYDVYTGPGKEYYREADGKAIVSSKDWVQVFGTDGNWALIQYRVNGALLRFGYIELDALQTPDAVPPLTLESTPLTDTPNEFVTSNPLGLGGRFQLPMSSVPMTRLGTLGEFWMYVELTMPNGQPARMFAEIRASHG